MKSIIYSVFFIFFAITLSSCLQSGNEEIHVFEVKEIDEQRLK